MEVVPIENTGVPTLGVVVTVCVVDVGRLQPFAVAVIIDVPFQLAA